MSWGIADGCDWFKARCGRSLHKTRISYPSGGGHMEIIRNLTRRKLRNILTISGIVIGVLALVTMGAMAEKFNALLSGGATYFGSNVPVGDSSRGAGGAFGGGLLTLDRVAALQKVEGVGAAVFDGGATGNA